MNYIYIYIYISKVFSGLIEYTCNIDIQHTIWTYESYIYKYLFQRTFKDLYNIHTI